MLQSQTWLRLQLRQRLEKEQKMSQLVKYKDTEQYLQLYIPTDYKKCVRHPYNNNNKNMRKPLLLHEVLTDCI